MFMEPNHSADKRPQTVRGEGEQGLLIKGQGGVVVTLPQGAVATPWRARPVFFPLLEESWVCALSLKTQEFPLPRPKK